MQDNPNNLTAAALIFAYRGDAPLVEPCVLHAKKTLPTGTEIYVADDGFAPLPEPVRETLEDDLGVHYMQTRWPRNGNLIGAEHLEGATRLMADIATTISVNSGDKNAVIVKIDPDAALLKCDWIRDLAASHFARLAGSFKTKIWYPMGNCYAVKANICAALADDAKRFTAWGASFEDYEIGIRIGRLCGGRTDSALRWRSGFADGFVLTRAGDIDYAKALDHCRVYCGGFGNAAGDAPKIQQGKILRELYARRNASSATPETATATPAATTAAKTPALGTNTLTHAAEKISLSGAFDDNDNANGSGVSLANPDLAAEIISAGEPVSAA